MTLQGEPEFAESCIACGLCLARCPYGALFLGTSDVPEFVPIAPDAAIFTDVGQTTFEQWTDSLEIRDCDDDACRTAATTLGRRLSGLTAEAFYPLIGSLLTALGHPTRVTPQGDTNLRFDAVILYEDDAIPVEIKSPTESYSINIKAVEQALENKIIITARNLFPHREASSSIAVGFEYPSQRSDVEELIEDIREAFGLSIGMVDLASLLRLLWGRREATPTDRSELADLQGRL